MLIFNINHLETHLTSTNPTKAEFEFLVHLVDFLGAYADAHFKLEEQCMECNRCPVHEQNRQAHEAYRSIFRNYKARCEGEGFTVEFLRALHESASVWVREHILVTDNDMPKLSGVELLKKVHAAGLALPVIMATGKFPSKAYARHPWLQPAVTLLKPYTFNQLVGAVQIVLLAITGAGADSAQAIGVEAQAAKTDSM